ncbi:MAG: hypothetical protein RIG77_03195 [Cyclobacteriaceae bacterium]
MSTKELKSDLISKISQIDDHSFLEALNIMLDSMSPKEGLLKVHPEARNEIEVSRNEILNGQFVENDLLEKETKKWLGEK